MQIAKTSGLLLEKPVPAEDYVQRGYMLVASAFRPFFPALVGMSEADHAALKEDFCTEAAKLAQGMLNADGLVEDRHIDLWVAALAGGSSVSTAP